MSQYVAFCVSKRHGPIGPAVAPGWSPTGISRIVALGSISVSLYYIIPGLGMSYFRENQWELGYAISFGNILCGGKP